MSASTSATGASSTRRTPARSSASRRWPAGTRAASTAPAASPRARKTRATIDCVGLRGSLQAAALVLVGALTLGAGNASAQGSPCGSTPGLLCSTVTVPLDRSGAIPGTVGLQGAIFLVAGGPGQGSAHAFSLGVPAAASLFRFLFPGYTLVAYDDRGTGDS